MHSLESLFFPPTALFKSIEVAETFERPIKAHVRHDGGADRIQGHEGGSPPPEVGGDDQQARAVVSVVTHSRRSKRPTECQGNSIVKRK